MVANVAACLCAVAAFAHCERLCRLSILQDKSKSDLQVEIDIGYALVFVSLQGTCLAYAKCSVAQLEELRAECDKELNNARLMGEFISPSHSFSLCRVQL